jgi:hypothetical protein
MRGALATGLLVSAGLVQQATAQPAAAQSDPKAIRENFNNYSLDLSVPESPAFALLGVAPQSVIHPTSVRAFAGSLVNGIGSGGEIQQGLALDTAPYALIAGDDMTLTRYRGDTLARRLMNTQLSIATAKAEEDPSGKGTKAAVGVHMKVYDLGDPRLSDELANCYEAASNAVFSATPINPKLPAEEREKLIAERQKMLSGPFASCRKAARDKLWNRTSWVIGLAGSWTNKGNISDGMRSDGSAVWTTFAYGFEGVQALERYAQLLVHGRLRDDEVVTNKAVSSGVATRDSSLLGTRLRLGSESGVFMVEGSYSWGRLDSGEKENVRRVAVGGEIKVSKDIWLVGSIGGEGGFADGARRNFVLGGLKFGSASEPQFGAK